MNKYRVTYNYAATGAEPDTRVIGVFDTENEAAALDSAMLLLCNARTSESVRAWTRGCLSAKQLLPKKRSNTIRIVTDEDVARACTAYRLLMDHEDGPCETAIRAGLEAYEKNRK